MQYIYAASVQGIQSFIFQTNKLKEIVGASQLVNQICTTIFKKCCTQFGHIVMEENLLMNAAGKIKYLVDQETAQKIVRSFPKLVANYAPGVSLNQTLVAYTGDLAEALEQIDQKLNIQRNRPNISVDIGMMGTVRARRTAGVGITYDSNGVVMDRGTAAKLEAYEKDKIGLFQLLKGEKFVIGQVPLNINGITNAKEKGWLAIIHADGNGLGNLIRTICSQIDTEHQWQAFKKFSKNLDQATKQAAKVAFEKVVEPIADWSDEDNIYPIRPVLLGGDDLIIIIRADLAFQFTKFFLKAFEKETAKQLAFLDDDYALTAFKNGLTACAGIAYIRTAYPFHYGVDLAEDLTKAAKTFSKHIHPTNAPSSIYFYKVQSSYLDDLNTMLARTHRADASSVSFDYGPYLIHENQPNVETLEGRLTKLQRLSDNPDRSLSIGKLRQWLSELNRDTNRAEFMLNRMYQIDDQLEGEFPQSQILEGNKGQKQKTMIHDLITLSSF